MSQHDYVIANGTGAAVRSDLNNALAAIVSNNSGATEPATMYAYQWWADTSTGLLKLRNAANNAWITLRELDGTLTIEAGTVSAPGLAFASDLNTGIYSPSADQLAIATNGVERVEWGTSEVVFNDGGANYDFRIEGDTNSSLFFVDASAEAVGIGTAAPSSLGSNVTTVEIQGPTTTRSGGIRLSSSDSSQKSAFYVYDGAAVLGTETAHPLGLYVSNTERCRVDTSGRFLVNTSSSVPVLSTVTGAAVQVNSSAFGSYAQTWFYGANNEFAPVIMLAKSRNTTYGSYTVVQNNDQLGGLWFAGDDGTDLNQSGAKIEAFVDGTPGNNDMPGRLVFSTTAAGASSPTERMRINSFGSIGFGCTPDGSASTLGVQTGGSAGWLITKRNSNPALFVNRGVDDGDLVLFYQADVSEGSISVSGTTVSYNGAHLSRWSQLPGGATREEILRGTVLSNIDEMCAWGEEENEQLNRMKVSDVEGDPNVAGVFQAWDDDDDTYTDDFYCAMTGDFIIRIADGVTVQRGDLLMSAGDGTAKPQDDDIIRSKTVAKVTSTHVTCTYDDGSYCVPCVLMAC
jgi:hypothetical protein